MRAAMGVLIAALVSGVAGCAQPVQAQQQRPEWTLDPSIRNFRFEDYPAERFTGRRPPLDFVNIEDSGHRAHRAQIIRDAKGEPDFGGRYVMTGWGCGTGCYNYQAINVSTGKIISVNAGREAELHYRPDSRLIFVTYWADEVDPDVQGATCYVEAYEVDGNRFKRLASALREHPNVWNCWLGEQVDE